MKNVHLYGGGGSRLPYIIGAAETLHKQDSPDIYLGNSAGALTAAFILEGLPASEMLCIIRRLNAFNAYKIYRKEFNPKSIPDNLYIQCTDLLSGNRYVVHSKECTSIQEYKDVLIASCTIPLLNKAYRTVIDNEDVKLVDGGYWHSLPRLGDVIDKDEPINLSVISSYESIPYKGTTNMMSDFIRAQKIDFSNKVLEDIDYLMLFNINNFKHVYPKQFMPPMWWNTKKQVDRLYNQGVHNTLSTC